MILAFTALLSSRALLFFFNDPEGPNLLIVGSFALGIYFLSLLVYWFVPIEISGIKRLALPIGVQLLTAAALYCCLR